MKKKNPKLSKPNPRKRRKHIDFVKFNAGESSVTIKAADGEGEEDGPKKIEMLAYTGGVMSVGYYGPIVVDLNGLEIAKGATPLFRDHDPERIVGHGNPVISNGQIMVDGTISVDNDLSREFVQSSEAGFPWQASIGAIPVRGKIDELGDGSKAKVNGREIIGPALIIRKAQLKEVSVVPLGADKNTVSRVAACFTDMEKECVMKFEAWLDEKGFVAAELDDKQLETLKASYEAEGHEDAEKVTSAPVTASVDTDKAVEAGIVAERERMAGITAACDTEGLDSESAKKMGEISAKAIADGSSVADVQASALKVIRASRASVPSVAIVADAADKQVPILEAAAIMQVGGKPEGYKPEEVKAAQAMRGLGIQRLMEICASNEGKSIPQVFGNETIKAAFTTTSLSGILSNVADKELLRGYDSVTRVSRELAGTRSVKDFKQVNAYRLVGSGKWDEVAPSGKITHGELADQSYTNQAKTYGEIITLNRQMIIDDDLGAFAGLFFILGRNAAMTEERKFFEVLNGNTGSFYAAGNSNLNTSNAFDSAGLAAAVSAMELQTDDKGNPIAITGTKILVPTALKFTAQQLIGSAQLMAVGDTDARNLPMANPHAGMFEVLSSPYLSNSLEGGSSATTWYLFADPMSVASYEFAYLNGVDQPTLETGSTDFDMLGMSWRGYHDFGLAQQDSRGSNKNTA
jgi:hypothetical protein